MGFLDSLRRIFETPESDRDDVRKVARAREAAMGWGVRELVIDAFFNTMRYYPAWFSVKASRYAIAPGVLVDGDNCDDFRLRYGGRSFHFVFKTEMKCEGDAHEDWTLGIRCGDNLIFEAAGWTHCPSEHGGTYVATRLEAFPEGEDIDALVGLCDRVREHSPRGLRDLKVAAAKRGREEFRV
jgi:hypothetical protein